MTLNPRACACLLATLLCLAIARPAIADGRADWRDYAWQKFAIAKCVPLVDDLVCPPYHQKWDWKRNQWVDIVISIDEASGQLHLTQQLTNRDPHDDDDVCVTLLVLDAAGRTVLAHHQNWHSLHGAVMQDSFSFRSRRLTNATTIDIGSKQCRKGPHQDDAVLAAVRAGIQP